MKSLLFLVPFLGALALAQDCQCPQVKCPSDDAAVLCQCINRRESNCAARCPDYVPSYLACPQPAPILTPTRPILTPTLPVSTPSPSTCVCRVVFCPMIWPLACTCANDGAKACYEKCGGASPTPRVCGQLTIASIPTPSPSPSFMTLALAHVVPSPSPISTTPLPVPTHAVCGGGRSNYTQCEEGFLCMKDPFKPGCGPACDGLGICVEDRLCGGFAGFACRQKGQTCVDDPRDSCDPKKGGSDCGGLCVWKSV